MFKALIRSISRFSDKTMLELAGDSEVSEDDKTIGPALVFRRLWQRTGNQKALFHALWGRKFKFVVERAIFLTVLLRLKKQKGHP